MALRPIVCLFVLAAAAPSVASEPLAIPADAQSALAERYPRTVDELRLIEQQVQRVAKQARPATVAVMVNGGAGSGVIVSADGLVLTAGHVIGRANRRATILLPDGRRLRGKTLGANHGIDAGMVQIDNPPLDLPYLPIAKEDPRVGQWVITLGQPGGPVDDRAPPLRLGRVLSGGDDWVCTDCTLVGGDSGGPLVNLRGEVLAVHSSIGPQIVHNFHIPVVEIEKSWKRLLAGEVWGQDREDVVATEMRPYMGVLGETREGRCIVQQVLRGMPAADAGIQAGDVVLSIDGEDIAGFDQLAGKVRKREPGQTVRVKIDRDGRTFDVELVLAGIGRPVPRQEREESK